MNSVHVLWRLWTDRKVGSEIAFCMVRMVSMLAGTFVEMESCNSRYLNGYEFRSL